MSVLSVVYVLTNPAMPGLVKIGRTNQEDANVRIGQLYTTGVPFPFKLEFACKVSNSEEVEKALHIAFAPYRKNPKREFFSIEPDQAIAILKLLHVEDATKEIEQQPSTIDPQSKAAGEQATAKRPRLNFDEMGILQGSELKSVHGDFVAIVTGPNKVSFNGEETSITAATRIILDIEYSVAPGPHWTFDGKLLRDIYNETYS